MIHYMKWKSKNGTMTFVYDDRREIGPESYFIMEEEAKGAKSELGWLIKDGTFIARDPKTGKLRLYQMREEPMRFFKEFIPRVFGFEPKIKSVHLISAVPKELPKELPK